MELSFTGKRVLVTGAGQGIGRGLSKKLVECGAEVYSLSRTASHLESLKSECPSIETVVCDLSDWDGSRQILQSLPPIHCLVNNAAMAICTPFLDIPPQEFDTLFNINVKAVLNVSQVIGRGMVERGEGGTIVNISSQASQAALADHAIYAATKGALDIMSKVMALELGPHQIRVNCVNPTVVMTDMGKVGWSKPEKADPMKAKIPQHRFAEVEDVVNAIVFLLSDKSDMINGATLPVDGGFLAC